MSQWGPLTNRLPQSLSSMPRTLAPPLKYLHKHSTRKTRPEFMSSVLGHSGWCPFSAILKQAVGQSVVHVFAYFLRMEIPEVECGDGETRPGRAPWAPPPQRKERGESGAPTSRGRDNPCSGGGLEQIPPSRFQPLKMLPGAVLPFCPAERCFGTSPGSRQWQGA